jgi:hypothetical protein
MKNAVHAEHSAKIIHFPGAEKILAEDDIEARLRNLGDVINDLLDAPYPGLLRERGRIRKALEELTVKEATLRWIIRIARTTEGAVQQRLWADIDRALTDLERIADSITQSEAGVSIAPFYSRSEPCQKKS